MTTNTKRLMCVFEPMTYSYIVLYFNI
jgi:hypothetical protein